MEPLWGGQIRLPPSRAAENGNVEKPTKRQRSKDTKSLLNIKATLESFVFVFAGGGSWSWNVVGGCGFASHGEVCDAFEMCMFLLLSSYEVSEGRGSCGLCGLVLYVPCVMCLGLKACLCTRGVGLGSVGVHISVFGIMTRHMLMRRHRRMSDAACSPAQPICVMSATSAALTRSVRMLLMSTFLVCRTECKCILALF